MCSVFSDWIFEFEKKGKKKKKKKTVCIDMYLYLPITASLPATQKSS